MNTDDRKWAQNLVVGPFIVTGRMLVRADRVTAITTVAAMDDERGWCQLFVDLGGGEAFPEVLVKAPLPVVTAAVILALRAERGENHLGA